jgi:hypothetical protein
MMRVRILPGVLKSTVMEKKKKTLDEIKKLIKAGAIPKKDLIDGALYIGEHRIANEAKWDAKEKQFRYQRYKFGNWYEDTCNHFEDDDGFALFVPIKLVPSEQCNSTH